MRVLDAQVDWKEGYGNLPKLQVLVDETPDRTDLRFQHEDGLWYAEHEGYAEFFAWTGPGNEGGFSGRCFEITTVSGEDVTLRGPYSSRAGCVNLRGLGPVVDVHLTTDPATLERGYTFRSGSLALPAAKQAVDLAAEASHLERILRFEPAEPYWVPVRDGGEA